jgi:hypothetical protein
MSGRRGKRRGNYLKNHLNLRQNHFTLSDLATWLLSRFTFNFSFFSMNWLTFSITRLAVTPRGTHHTLETALDEINQWYVGWSNYYSLTYYPAQLKKIEAHIRRRLRSRIVDQQKRKKHLYRKLIKRGVSWKKAGNAMGRNIGSKWLDAVLDGLLFCIGSEEAVASVCPQHRAYGSVLRSRIVDQQKRKKHLYRKLIKRGVSRKQAGNAIFSNNKRWVLSKIVA